MQIDTRKREAACKLAAIIKADTVDVYAKPQLANL